MAGYLNDPEATAATLDADGWLHTGDIATVDAEGVFTIVDRLKELIKYKGYQVAPAELEARAAHPRPDRRTPRSSACATTRARRCPRRSSSRGPAPSLTAADVMAFVAERVAPYKKVRAVEFVDAIPKSAAGKILRRHLRAREAKATPSPGAARTGL